MRQPQESAHLRTVFDQPYASAAKPYVTACLLVVGLTRVYRSEVPAYTLNTEYRPDENRDL